MIRRPKGPQAARWRQRKYQALARYPIPEDLLPGSLTLSLTRCGKPNCHCAKGPGHPAWTLTFMSQGRHRTLRIPKAWAEEVQRRLQAGRQFQDAVREVLTANAELLALALRQSRQRRR